MRIRGTKSAKINAQTLEGYDVLLMPGGIGGYEMGTNKQDVRLSSRQEVAIMELVQVPLLVVVQLHRTPSQDSGTHGMPATPWIQWDLTQRACLSFQL